MPGELADADPVQKRYTDWKVLLVLSKPIFYHRMRMTTRVAHNSYRVFWKRPIPYRELGFADLVSYFRTVRGLIVERHEIHNQFVVMADEEVELDEFNILAEEFFPGQQFLVVVDD